MSESIWIREMRFEDVPAVVALQKLAFPPPFSEELHWDPEHLVRHIELFPEGQLVADCDGEVVGSCSNTIVSEHAWRAHGSWYETVGGPDLHGFAPLGTTLYGLDISVHPEHRRAGIGRRFYQSRFELVRRRGLARYGTGCRLPDFRSYQKEHPEVDAREYARRVVAGEASDRTLTPLLRYGLDFVGVKEKYMEDDESGDAAALLEWRP
jgi:GNAT superfamily N-acetyltransferase